MCHLSIFLLLQIKQIKKRNQPEIKTKDVEQYYPLKSFLDCPVVLVYLQ